MANSAAAVKADKPPRKVMKKSVRDTLTAYTFIAPNFIGFCVFTLVPMVFAIALAFCSWDGRHDIEFVAIDNFVRLFTQDRIFQAALVNTIVYVIGTVPLTLVCSLAMAVLLNQNVRLRNFFRTVAFFPYVASLVAVAAVWNMIFNPAMGPINSLLSALGRGEPAPLGRRQGHRYADGHPVQRVEEHGLLHGHLPGRPAGLQP